MKNTPLTVLRWRASKISANSAVAAGTSAASPVATKNRATVMCRKLSASPEAAVHTLQTKTPAAMMRGRPKRSASEPMNTAMTPKLKTQTTPERNPNWVSLRPSSAVIWGANATMRLRST